MAVAKNAKTVGIDASMSTEVILPVRLWSEMATKGAMKRERSITESKAPIDVPICISGNTSAAYTKLSRKVAASPGAGDEPDLPGGWAASDGHLSRPPAD
jgi:hypothetical protein